MIDCKLVTDWCAAAGSVRAGTTAGSGRAEAAGGRPRQVLEADRQVLAQLLAEVGGLEDGQWPPNVGRFLVVRILGAEPSDGQGERAVGQVASLYATFVYSSLIRRFSKMAFFLLKNDNSSNQRFEA